MHIFFSCKHFWPLTDFGAVPESEGQVRACDARRTALLFIYHTVVNN